MTQTTQGPAITSSNLPAAVKPGATSAPTPEQVAHAATQVQDDSNIVAKPLVSPDFTQIKPVNPAMSLRFINRLALGGQRFKEAQIQGFIICKPTDLANIPKTMSVVDNTVQYQDVIVMMMPKVDYLGAIKYNNERANKLVSKQATFGKGLDEMNSALNEVTGSRADKAKIKLFQPDRD